MTKKDLEEIAKLIRTVVRDELSKAKETRTVPRDAPVAKASASTYCQY